MIRNLVVILALILPIETTFGQAPKKVGDDEPVVRISTELVQVDVVVTDRNGGVVKGLTQDDFELYEKGKKQQINFFEFVEAGVSRHWAEFVGSERVEGEPRDIREEEVKRIFAFVVDDLTIRFDDLIYVREMLRNYVDNLMQPSDLVAIVRTAGGRGMLQQFTTDKTMLRRAIESLTPSNHPLRLFSNPDQQLVTTSDVSRPSLSSPEELSGDLMDITDQRDDVNLTLRTRMSLGTAGFLIDSMRQLPGRKSLVLVSSGMPALSGQTGTISANNVALFLDSLADRASRAGVVIHTMDIRALGASVGIASFDDTPGRSALGVNPSAGPRARLTIPGIGPGFGRGADETQLGPNNPVDQIEAHMGLRVLASATGGIAVLEKNDFHEGLNKILATSEAYYLLAYTPSDSRFDGDFRKLEVRARGGYKVHSRRGYRAREDEPQKPADSKQEQILRAVLSPLSRNQIELDAVLLYRALPPDRGSVEINMLIDPRTLELEPSGQKQVASFDLVGFVFDELGALRGGFSETVNASLTEEELAGASRGGLSYTARTALPAGSFMIRLAVRDNKGGGIGTLTRYLEVPDLSTGKLIASSLHLGAVDPGEAKQHNAAPLGAGRRISRTQDLRYVVLIHNAKPKSGQKRLTTQLIVSQSDRLLFREPQDELKLNGDEGTPVVKIGQLGLSKVKPGRYTVTLAITDENAGKTGQTITRSMDFVVVD